MPPAGNQRKLRAGALRWRRLRLFWRSIAEFFGDAALHCFILIAPMEVSGLRLVPALGPKPPCSNVHFEAVAQLSVHGLTNLIAAAVANTSRFEF